MLKFFLADKEGFPAHYEPYNVIGEEDNIALVTTTIALAHSTFKSVTRTTAGTSIITIPSLEGAIVITDILITGEKRIGATITVRFTDDTNTINLLIGDAANNSINLGHAFNGLVQGWRNSRVELVTVADVTATVTLVYYKVEEGLSFLEWDSRR
ncbi:MAG: hypothetical protein V3R78_10170 [Thermodesulfobacteriota bacterium]